MNTKTEEFDDARRPGERNDERLRLLEDRDKAMLEELQKIRSNTNTTANVLVVLLLFYLLGLILSAFEILKVLGILK